MSTTTHVHEYEHDSIINNNKTSLTTIAPTEDRNNVTIVESSTIEFDVSGCRSKTGEFFTNSCTIADSNDCVKKRNGGDMLNRHHHDDAYARGVLASIGKPTEEGRQ